MVELDAPVDEHYQISLNVEFPPDAETQSEQCVYYDTEDEKFSKSGCTFVKDSSTRQKVIC